MKKRYLLTFALAGMLIFGNAPLQVNAMSPGAGGTIVEEPRDDAGDTVDIGGGDVPQANGAGTGTATQTQTQTPGTAAQTPEEQTPVGDDTEQGEAPEEDADDNTGTPESDTPDEQGEDIGDNDVPQAGGEGENVTDDDVPLAVLSADAQTSRFSWWGFWLGVLVATVVETVLWFVLGKKKDKQNEK